VHNRQAGITKPTTERKGQYIPILKFTPCSILNSVSMHRNGLVVYLLLLRILYSVYSSPTIKLQPNKHFVLLSGPSQSSKLLSDILLHVPGLGAAECARRGCSGANEGFNPRCQCKDAHRYSRGHCMGHEDTSSLIWHDGCPRFQWNKILQYVVAKNITFTRVNFGVMKMDLFLTSGFQVLVAWKAPWDTFPTQNYDRVYDSLSTSHAINGTIVGLLRDYAATLIDHNIGKILPQSMCKGILAHYIFFYRLITRALERNLKIIETTKLLTLPPLQLREYYKEHMPFSLLHMTSDVLDILVNATVSRRFARSVTMQNGTSTFEEVIMEKRRQFPNLLCSHNLKQLSSYCASVDTSCAEYNRYININSFLSGSNS